MEQFLYYFLFIVAANIFWIFEAKRTTGNFSDYFNIYSFEKNDYGVIGVLIVNFTGVIQKQLKIM